MKQNSKEKVNTNLKSFSRFSNSRFSNFSTNKGFTLVELLIVIAILGILAVSLYWGYTGYMERARDTNRKTALHNIALAMNTYSHENYKIPKPSISNEEETNSITLDENTKCNGNLKSVSGADLELNSSRAGNELAGNSDLVNGIWCEGVVGQSVKNEMGNILKQLNKDPKTKQAYKYYTDSKGAFYFVVADLEIPQRIVKDNILNYKDSNGNDRSIYYVTNFDKDYYNYIYGANVVSGNGDGNGGGDGGGSSPNPTPPICIPPTNSGINSCSYDNSNNLIVNTCNSGYIKNGNECIVNTDMCRNSLIPGYTYLSNNGNIFLYKKIIEGLPTNGKTEFVYEYECETPSPVHYQEVTISCNEGFVKRSKTDSEFVGSLWGDGIQSIGIEESRDQIKYECIKTNNNCITKNINGYNIPAINHGNSLQITKIIDNTPTNGSTIYTATASCNNGDINIGGENFSIACREGTHTKSGNLCIAITRACKPSVNNSKICSETYNDSTNSWNRNLVCNDGYLPSEDKTSCIKDVETPQNLSITISPEPSDNVYYHKQRVALTGNATGENSANYEYEWYISSNNIVNGNLQGNPTEYKLIGNGKNLEYTLDNPTFFMHQQNIKLVVKNTQNSQTKQAEIIKSIKVMDGVLSENIAELENKKLFLPNNSDQNYGYAHDFCPSRGSRLPNYGELLLLINYESKNSKGAYSVSEHIRPIVYNIANRSPRDSDYFVTIDFRTGNTYIGSSAGGGWGVVCIKE